MAMDQLSTIELLDGSTEEHLASSRQKLKSAKRSRTRKPKKILHFLSTQAVASPFDVNMAVDSGYDVIMPHVNIDVGHTRALVQDAIFSRPPEFGRYTGIFIGGKDALMALDMLDEVKNALVPPFQVKAFADPGGSFTTAAAMVAFVERIYREKAPAPSLKGASVAVFGATGVVGFTSAVIAAIEGARVTVVTHMGLPALKPLVIEAEKRFGVKLTPVLGARDSDKIRIVGKSDIVMCAAAAGVRVLEKKHFKQAKKNIVVADVNAVPPSGIEQVGMFDTGGTVVPQRGYAIGPLAIGDIKYKTQAALLRKMTSGTSPEMLDFRAAFALARQIVLKRDAE